MKWLLAMSMALVVAGCGSDSAATTTSTTPQVTTTVQAVTSTTTTPVSTTTSVVAAPATTVPDIDVEIQGGDVTGPAVFALEVNDTLDIWVVSDTADQIHVHGYDRLFDLEAGTPLNVVFVANLPGVFDVELEDGHNHLFDIEVSG